MNNHSCVERNQTLGRGQQRVDINLSDPGLFHHQLTESHQKLLERGHVDGLTAANTLQCLKNSCLFYHSTRQSGVQRRQGKGTVLEDLHQLPASTKEQHWAELRVRAAANNQLVSVHIHHRLHGYAKEMLLTRAFLDRCLDCFPGTTHCSGI